MMPCRFATILLCCAVFAGTLSADEPNEFTSPADLWRGYDPTALPLEIESLKRWEEDGCAFEKLRFTAEELGGVKARVLAMQGSPPGSDRLPGILHIHGGGQTLSPDWVRFWTKRGYVCVTYDFCGPWANRTEVTDWGTIKQANMAEAQGGHQVVPTPRESSWYHWTLAARRALTLLENHPRVDRDRVGIFGISMGGTLCWSVAGSDARVKAVVPIYGCGYNVDRRRTRWGFPDLTAELALFQRVVSPEAHAPYITCPVLYLSSTNDFHGWMDTAYDILPATAGSHWQALTPRQNHHIAPEQGANLPAWMDYQLKGGPAFPQSPTIAIQLNADGTPQAVVAASDVAVEHVEIFYSLNDKPPPSRFWRSAKATSSGAGCLAELAVLDTWRPVFTFANVHYTSGVCLTTNLAQCVPSQLGKANATLRPEERLNPRTIAESWVYATAYTDPVISKRFVVIEDQSDRPSVVRLNDELFGGQLSVNLATHAISDPQFTGADDQRLAIDCRGTFDDEGLSITLYAQQWTPTGKTYRAVVAKSQLGSDWTTLAFSPADFHTAEGDTLHDWQNLDKIQLQGRASKDGHFGISNLRWLKTSSPR